MRRKPAVKFYLSVEGQTEARYFEHLCTLINSSDRFAKTLSIDCRKKEPLTMAKSITIPIGVKIDIYNVVDIESLDELHEKRLKNIIDGMKKAEKLGKHISYHLCYSNFTFELWLILHKRDLRAQLSDRSQYLRYINNVFDEHFQSLDDFKREADTKRCLSRITLDDVEAAVKRATEIMAGNAEKYSQVEYKRMKYYRENPALSVHEVVERMLASVGT